MASERTIFDFTYLQHALLKCLKVVGQIDEEGNLRLTEDLDELIELCWKAPDESVWRRIPVELILPGPGREPRAGEYWAKMLARDKPDEPPRIVRQIRAELTLRRAEDDSGQTGPVYVRACSGALDLMRNATSELRAENDRLAERLAKANDDADRLRNELFEARSKILELQQQLDDLEEENPLGELFSLMTQVVQQETKTPAQEPPAIPAAPVLPEQGATQ